MSENFTVEMYDATGKTVFQKTNNSTVIDIGATGFENGMYFVNIITESGVQFGEKILKQ